MSETQGNSCTNVPEVFEAFASKIKTNLQRYDIKHVACEFKQILNEMHVILQLQSNEDAKKADELLTNAGIYSNVENGNFICILCPNINETNDTKDEKNHLVDEANKIITSDLNLAKASGNMIIGYNHLFQVNEGIGASRAEFPSVEQAAKVAEALRSSENHFHVILKGKGIVLLLTSDAQKKEYEKMREIIRTISNFLVKKHCSILTKTFTFENFQRNPKKVFLNFKTKKRRNKAAKLLQQKGYAIGELNEKTKSFILLSVFPNDAAVFEKTMAKTEPAPNANGHASSKNSFKLTVEPLSNDKAEVAEWLQKIREANRELLQKYGLNYSHQQYLNKKGSHCFGFEEVETAQKAYELFEQRYGDRVQYTSGKKTVTIIYFPKKKKRGKGKSKAKKVMNKVIPKKVILKEKAQKSVSPKDKILALSEKMADAVLEAYPEKVLELIWKKLQAANVALVNLNKKIVIKMGNSEIKVDPNDLKTLKKADFIKISKK
ncbi:MAG: hypothetical protein US50_C0004G0007 [Candidatus Nomurabacteria bacterium GW2011_GWB1_37_5]|uniref:Uncharacterized protein n=1 Tax=Candidatus Nomurabacteria bacterium GW2011_GWB1_37_5 TaxID=1618742 RepID=A0A0G0GXW3_9BACT|nr:MAG: hypothetical protein US50_C0004G0007 [Candidatus Nomurabacteria bacterium GW2011_GWB1_37_5]